MAQFLKTGKRKPLAVGVLIRSCSFSSEFGPESEKNWNKFELEIETYDEEKDKTVHTKLVYNRYEAERLRDYLNEKLAEKRD